MRAARINLYEYRNTSRPSTHPRQPASALAEKTRLGLHLARHFGGARHRWWRTASAPAPGRQALAEARAAGEPTDPAQIIPPPAADAENFAAIPLFQPLFDYEPSAPGPGNGLTTTHWRNPEAKARVEALKLPPAHDTGNFRRGQFVDLTVWQRELKVADEAGTPGAAVLGALRKFDPELDALREAAKRPRARFPIRYQDHVAALLPHITVLLNLSRIAALRAVAELAEGDTEAAHGDVLLGLALEESLREEPLLISPLVRAASLETCLQPLWEGLARRQWNEAQLASLDAALQRADFIAAYQSAIRGERADPFACRRWTRSRRTRPCSGR